MHRAESLGTCSSSWSFTAQPFLNEFIWSVSLVCILEELRGRVGQGPQGPSRSTKAGSSILFNDIPPKPTMALAQSKCLENSYRINKCYGGEGFGLQMMAKGRGLAAEYSFVLGTQLEVQVTFPGKVSGLDSHLPVELEVQGMWGWGGSAYGEGCL